MLTPKEIQLINKVLEGKTSKEIAYELHYSKRTIEGMRRILMDKFNCKSLYEVIGVCFRNRWIE